jgi:hypothetical protein
MIKIVIIQFSSFVNVLDNSQRDNYRQTLKKYINSEDVRRPREKRRENSRTHRIILKNIAINNNMGLRKKPKILLRVL